MAEGKADYSKTVWPRTIDGLGVLSKITVFVERDFVPFVHVRHLENDLRGANSWLILGPNELDALCRMLIEARRCVRGIRNGK